MLFKAVVRWSLILVGVWLLFLFYAWAIRGEQQPEGISFEGKKSAAHVRLLKDLTWVAPTGARRSQQQIFTEIFSAIEKAERFILLDMFLFNDFGAGDTGQERQLSKELTNRLVRQKQRYPEMQVVVISDPVNTVYGALESQFFAQLAAAGINVVVTNLDALKDSNRAYSVFWRLFIRPFGDAEGGLLPNPFTDGRSESRVSLRSYLRMLNFKANHRKMMICDDGEELTGFVISANPHDGSSAHSNLGVQLYGEAVFDLLQTEQAVMALSGEKPVQIDGFSRGLPEQREGFSTVQLQVLTEKKILDAIIRAVDHAVAGDTIDMMMFYLSHRDVIAALKRAHRRGVVMRLVLDPNKDAFGREKNGIPNRPVAVELVREDIPVRWCNTQGEQCHSKLLFVRYQTGNAQLLSGSANFTRRNLNDFNLETDLLLEASLDNPIMISMQTLFDDVWTNTPDRQFTVPYDVHAENILWKRWLYLLMEKTGMSTF